MNPFISVIIPTYNDWDRLKLCIDALAKQTYNNEGFEVIIVNNNPDDIPPKLYLPKNYRIINEGRPGSYAARNAGIKDAKGDILAFTDSDCIPNSEWLENSVIELQNGADRIAGKIDLIFESEKLNLIELYEDIFTFRQDYYVTIGASVTANMITWKKCFETVGLFNDKLMSGGDIEWGKRANKYGYNIIFGKNCVIKHPARSNFKDVLKKIKRTSIGWIKYRKEHGDLDFKWFYRGFHPPINKVFKVIKKNDLSIKTKLMLSMLLYVFKLFKTYNKIIFYLKDYFFAKKRMRNEKS